MTKKQEAEKMADKVSHTEKECIAGLSVHNLDFGTRGLLPSLKKEVTVLSA